MGHALLVPLLLVSASTLLGQDRRPVPVTSFTGPALQPFATQDDGDTPYAVTTGEVDNPDLSPVDLGVVASEDAWDEFSPGTRAVVASGPRGLTIELDDHESLYLPPKKAVGLLPVAPDEFLIQAERPGGLRFTRSATGAITGLHLNPGPWAIPATRLP